MYPIFHYLHCACNRFPHKFSTIIHSKSTMFLLTSWRNLQAKDYTKCIYFSNNVKKGKITCSLLLYTYLLSIGNPFGYFSNFYDLDLCDSYKKDSNNAVMKNCRLWKTYTYLAHRKEFGNFQNYLFHANLPVLSLRYKCYLVR